MFDWEHGEGLALVSKGSRSNGLCPVWQILGLFKNNPALMLCSRYDVVAEECWWLIADCTLTASFLFIPHRLHATLMLAQLRQAKADAYLEQCFKLSALPGEIHLSRKPFFYLPRSLSKLLEPILLSFLSWSLVWRSVI